MYGIDIPIIQFCPFCSVKTKNVGLSNSSARQCANAKCAKVFVLRERQEGEVNTLSIGVYDDTLQAASGAPQDFQISLF